MDWIINGLAVVGALTIVWNVGLVVEWYWRGRPYSKTGKRDEG